MSDREHPRRPDLGQLRRRYRVAGPGATSQERQVEEAVLVCAAACVAMTPAGDLQEVGLKALDAGLSVFLLATASAHGEEGGS